MEAKNISFKSSNEKIVPLTDSQSNTRDIKTTVPNLDNAPTKINLSSDRDLTDQVNTKLTSDADSVLIVSGHLNRLTSVIVNTIQIILQMS